MKLATWDINQGITKASLGEFVPQDLNNDSASALLDRIRDERQANGATQ